jgi:phosphoribosylaminoimidazolecarboxamide formyltransferase / IMP cyclohydrolase
VRAILSVYDKTGLEGFARGLAALGVDLVASGGTGETLRRAGIAHQTVEEVTGAEEMLSGRVKTLHPAIHGGILADLSDPSHVADLEARGIEAIGMVVSNLYPFASQPSVEMIDIGGPAMVRAAAKNHAHVTVIVDPGSYGEVLDELRREGEVGPATRRRLARKAFAHVAAYDAAIVSWFDESLPPGELPPSLHLALERAQELRYGENPHQVGARYRSVGEAGGFWETIVQHGGRELSYLNLFDTDAAWRLAGEVAELSPSGCAAVIVKHANPCGAATAADLETAYRLAFEGDPLSAFGGILALSGSVDDPLAEVIVAHPLADVLVAPRFSEGALRRFAEARKNMRVLEAAPPGPAGWSLRQVDGGMLVQEPDRLAGKRESWTVVTKAAPTEAQWADLQLAWLVCARTASNAIVLARDAQVVGVGCGQQSRVDAARLAVRKADGRAEGGVAASDAYFPFRDGLDALAEAGAVAVIQPGGSLRDDEVVAAADERGIAMVMTGERHFRH